MARFGDTLKALRTQAGWRQIDLVEALGNAVARSTLANIESGREPPTPRIWRAICVHLPQWTSSLEPDYRAARDGRNHVVVGRTPDARIDHGASRHSEVTIELIRYVYIFRYSRSPEEIIEVRSVRAQVGGVDGFDLKLATTRQMGFRVDEECLWGGDVVATEYRDSDGVTSYVRRVDFGRRLERGQTHVFAVRSWVTSDPEPGASVSAAFTVPCKRVAFQLNFWGPVRPSHLWRFGPVPDGSVSDEGQAIGKKLQPSASGAVAAEFRGVRPGCEYGVGWSW